MADEDQLEELLTTLSIPVEPPIVVKGHPYASLDLREPRVSEVKAAEELMGSLATPASVLNSEAKLVALVTGWPDEAVGELPASLLNQAAAFLETFEQRGRGLAEDGPTLLIQLDEPVVVQKGPHGEMALREPKVAERRRAEQHLSKGVTPATSRAAEISLVTDISEWHPAAVLKMPISVFARAADFTCGFLERGRRTGAVSPRS